MHPGGAMPQRGQDAVDRSRLAGMALAEVLQESSSDGARPLVGMVGAGGLMEEGEKGFQVALLGLEGVIRSGSGFQPHVEAEPGNQTITPLGRQQHPGRCRSGDQCGEYRNHPRLSRSSRIASALSGSKPCSLATASRKRAARSFIAALED